MSFYKLDELPNVKLEIADTLFDKFIAIWINEKRYTVNDLEFVDNNLYGSELDLGKCLLEGTYKKDDILISYSQHEKAMNVSVIETNHDEYYKTLYSRYFFKDFDEIRKLIEMSVKNEDDRLDLIFKLSNIKER